MRYKLTSEDECKRILRRVRREYTVQSEEDDDRTLAVKEALCKLPADEQAIFILHTEIGSYRELSKILGVSRTAIHNRVKEITEKIKNNLCY